MTGSPPAVPQEEPRPPLKYLLSDVSAHGNDPPTTRGNMVEKAPHEPPCLS